MAKKRTYEPAMMKSKNWENRITEYGEESPEQLLANPLNWRVHPKAQQISITGVLDDIGFIAPIIVNKTTGHMIDGHMRVSLALRNNVSKVPVVYVELTEQEEREALLTLDPITNMAVADMQNLEALISDLDDVNDAVKLLIGDIFDASSKKAVKQELDATDSSENESESNFTEDPFGITQEAIKDAEGNERKYPIFISDNEWGIPVLDVTMQCTKKHTLIETWGRNARHNTRMPGMWHFYTDDYRFTGIWRDPDVLIKTGSLAAIEPNFSTSEIHPKAEVLYNIWRKRWLAKYWQFNGVETVVDLNVAPEFWDLNLLGVPKGWKSYATRWYARFDDINWQFEKAKQHAESDDITFFVFETKTKNVEEICNQNGWIFVPMYSNVMRGMK
jgi:hypothetical protein